MIRSTISFVLLILGGILILYVPAALTWRSRNVLVSRSLQYINVALISVILTYLVIGISAKSTTKYSDLGNKLLLYSGTSIDCKLVSKNIDGSLLLKGPIVIDGTDFGENTRLKPGKFDVAGKDVYDIVMRKCLLTTKGS